MTAMSAGLRWRRTGDGYVATEYDTLEHRYRLRRDRHRWTLDVVQLIRRTEPCTMWYTGPTLATARVNGKAHGQEAVDVYRTLRAGMPDGRTDQEALDHAVKLTEQEGRVSA